MPKERVERDEEDLVRLYLTDIGQYPLLTKDDEVRLAQVVSNLLINAAKFTPDPGVVRLRLSVDNPHAVVEVADEGVGIEAELLPHVFELFVQAAQPIDRRSGGLGLGLAIVKMLVRMHGGAVEAASDGPGRGSRFTVRLPLAGDALAPASAPGGGAPGVRPLGWTAG